MAELAPPPAAAGGAADPPGSPSQRHVKFASPLADAVQVDSQAAPSAVSGSARPPALGPASEHPPVPVLKSPRPPAAAAAAPPTPAAPAAPEAQLLMMRHERQGFELVDADSLHAKDSGLLSTPQMPQSTATRVQSARKQRPASGRPVSGRRPRASSARLSTSLPRRRVAVQHSAGFKPEPGAGLCRFTSEVGRDSFESWVRRKKETAARKKVAPLPSGAGKASKQDRQRLNQASYEAWLARKNRTQLEKRQKEREATTRKDGKRFTHASADREFQNWLEAKAERQKVEKQEARLRRQLREEQLNEQDVRRQMADDSFRQWTRRKAEADRRKREEAKAARKRQNAEMRRIRASLQRVYLEDGDDAPLWRKANSLNVRRRARTHEHARVLSETLHAI